MKGFQCGVPFFIQFCLYLCETKLEPEQDMNKISILLASLLFLQIGISQVSRNDINLIDYKANPETYMDVKANVFADRGAWFGFSYPENKEHYGGFVGPMIMSMDNGLWLGKNSCQLFIEDHTSKRNVDWNGFEMKSTAFRSHLIQMFENPELVIIQTLMFTSKRSAILYTQVQNKTEKAKTLKFKWKIHTELPNVRKIPQSYGMLFKSATNNSRIMIYGLDKFPYVNPRSPWPVQLDPVTIEPGEMHELHMGITVMLGGDDFKDEEKIQKTVKEAFLDSLEEYQIRKNKISSNLRGKLHPYFQDSSYVIALNKSALTLQSNWRAAADLLKHDGIIPSYSDKDFHGFWAWDSWKHAAALVHIDTALAKNQLRAMYDYMTDEGFIPDCIFRDTTQEKHNFRNTKPPLSGWAVWEIYKETQDQDFLREMYPKILKQHQWWYVYRDSDKDGLCEYGSQDGSLEAAKWESGMDNAVRFDQTKMLNQGDSIFTMDQESVDLNSYLLQEKLILAYMSMVLKDTTTARAMKGQTKALMEKIQSQFYDASSGWFYDTSLDGKTFVKSMGCEGWIPLWANIASEEQAEKVKENMMTPEKFFGSVPFQTLSASDPNFKPENGYWRGPVWLDQAYFGVRALYNYGYKKEAQKATMRLVRNSEGIIEKGEPIRENYHPQTGKGMDAKNFSWSAAHIILLLIDK